MFTPWAQSLGYNYESIFSLLFFPNLQSFSNHLKTHIEFQTISVAQLGK